MFPVSTKQWRVEVWFCWLPGYLGMPVPEKLSCPPRTSVHCFHSIGVTHLIISSYSALKASMWGADTVNRNPMLISWGEIKLPHLDHYLNILLLLQAWFEKWEKCKHYWDIPVIMTSPAIFLTKPNIELVSLQGRWMRGWIHKLWKCKDWYGLFFSLGMSGWSTITLRGRGEKREYKLIGDMERSRRQASASQVGNLSKKASSDSNTGGNFLICFLRPPWASPQKTEFRISVPSQDQTALFYLRPRSTWQTLVPNMPSMLVCVTIGPSYLLPDSSFRKICFVSNGPWCSSLLSHLTSSPWFSLALLCWVLNIVHIYTGQDLSSRIFPENWPLVKSSVQQQHSLPFVMTQTSRPNDSVVWRT